MFVVDPEEVASSGEPRADPSRVAAVPEPTRAAVAAAPAAAPGPLALEDDPFAGIPAFRGPELQRGTLDPALDADGLAHATPELLDPCAVPPLDPLAVAPAAPGPRSAVPDEEPRRASVTATQAGDATSGRVSGATPAGTSLSSPGAGATELLDPGPAPGKRRRIPSEALWLGLLVAMAGVLVVAARGGLGPRRVGARAGLVEVESVRAGAYDTVGGAAAIVRGEVIARQRVPGAVRVHVEIVARDGTVSAADALAGGHASPEEVFEGATPDRVLGLRRTIDARASPSFAPGARAPFLVVFPAPALDLTGAEVRASAEPIAAVAR